MNQLLTSMSIRIAGFGGILDVRPTIGRQGLENKLLSFFYDLEIHRHPSCTPDGPKGMGSSSVPVRIQHLRAIGARPGPSPAGRGVLPAESQAGLRLHGRERASAPPAVRDAPALKSAGDCVRKYCSCW